MGNASDLLELPLFDINVAARILDIGQTLTYWLNGLNRDGIIYDPPLRPEYNDDRIVTWGEFIEAALLRELRQVHRVSLREARTLRADLIQRDPGVRHPLAVHSVFVNGRRLAGALRTAGIEDALTIEPATGTIRSGQFVETFMRRIEWRNAVPTAYRPSLDHRLVTIEPGRQFGAPQVQGVSTRSIFELVEEAGMLPEEVADLRSCSLDAVREALGYERSTMALT